MEQQLFMFREEILPSTLTKGFVKMSDKLLVTPNFDENFNEIVVPIHDGSEWKDINPLSYREIISSTPPPLEYAMYPWLPIQGIAFIYAATGVGKTLFTLNVAYAIAAGGSFLKYRCPKRRRVLYVDGEMSYTQIHGRLMDVIKQQGKLDQPENFFLFTPDKTPVGSFKICQPEGQAFYNQQIDQNKIDVLVLDNLSTLSMFDENSAMEWKVIQDWLLSLRSRGITVIVVHHAGKDKFGYRGTSRMLDAVNTAISLRDVAQSDLENERHHCKKFEVHYEKNRDFGGADAVHFAVTLTKSGWEFESMEQSNMCCIVDMIENLKMKQVDVAKELGLKTSHLNKLVQKLRGEGRIKS